MKANNTHSSWPYIIVPSMILLVPFIAQMFTPEVNWTLFDFLVAGIILFSTSLLMALIVKSKNTKRTKTMVIVLILLLVITLWIELAVVLFNSPMAGS